MLMLLTSLLFSELHQDQSSEKVWGEVFNAVNELMDRLL